MLSRSGKVIGGTRRAGLVSAAVLTIAAPFTSHYEGVRLKAYLDPVGIPTICHGETLNVELGDELTKEECDALFETRLGWFAYRVNMHVQEPMSPETHAAFTSFAYNVGVNGFARSSARRLYNEGQPVKACHALMNWYRAGGRDCRVRENNCYGLVVRRQAEVDLCLKGLESNV